jgi:cyclic beta-1,2-glucan synthetase
MGDAAAGQANPVATSPGEGWPARDPLEGLAFELARNLRLNPEPRNLDPVPARLKSIESFLRSAYQYFEESGKSQAVVSHAAEWVLDNFYVIEQAVRQVRENLPADFYRRLPKVHAGRTEMARVYVLSAALMRHTESRLQLDQLTGLVQTFQAVSALTIGELWALPALLRLCTLETLADSLARITGLTLPGASRPDPLPAFVSDLPDPPPRDETVAINSVISLRFLAMQDWKAFFEATSLVEAILRNDPAQAYAPMNFETRNRYRNEIEELAHGSHLDEVVVAGEVVRCAEAAEDRRARHVGYFLIDAGRSFLERELGYQPPPGLSLRCWLVAHALPSYTGAIAALTATLCAVAVWYAAHYGAGAMQALAAFLLALLPASAISADLVNWLVVRIVPPRVLPRFDFRDGIPPDCRTVVVIPSLLKNDAELQSLLHQIEEHFLSNPDPNVRFALLTDFVDAPLEVMPGETELLGHARDGVGALNEKYHLKGYQPFLLFHRNREWNAGENCWMGWERKRGKLEEFNAFLAGERKPTLEVALGDLAILPSIRYVITLDADTTLPRDSVRRLVGTLAHPLNRAEFDPQTGRLAAGYTVLQPRVQVRPVVANQSPFARIYSGDTVLDLYTRAVSDVYQDLFGEGSYVGKGIYDVQAFTRTLQARIPDNAILSHDMFEGIQGRCGLVSDVILFEDYPAHYPAFTRRMHRWMRGDWQLLPWLMPRIPHRPGGRIRNDLSPLGRWKIFDNLRRSLVTPAVLLLLVAGWTLLPGPPALWLLMALSTYLLAVLTGLLAALRARTPENLTEAASHSLRQALFRSLLQLAFLPHESLVSLDAVLTTLVRLYITRKHLLQWVTAAHTVNVFGRELKLRVAWQEMIAAPLFAGIFVLSLSVLFPLRAIGLAIGLATLWLVSPYIAYRISRPDPRPVQVLSPETRQRMRLLARSTWLYFEHFVGPEDHWLPPDHYQEDPRRQVAHRTSPTNIGLFLLSTLSAYDFGYIGPQELAVRIRNTLDGMDGLEKQRGHFLNWYDTRSLSPFIPRYISTVDNGNLVACLIALRQGLADVPERPVASWDGLIDLLDMLDQILHQARLGPVDDELHDAISHMRAQVGELRGLSKCSPDLLADLFEGSRQKLEDLLVKMVEESQEQFDTDMLHSLSVWIDRTRHHMTVIQRDIQQLCPWAIELGRAPDLFIQPSQRPDLTAAWIELHSLFVFKPAVKEIPAICEHARQILGRIPSLLDGREQEALEWCQGFERRVEQAGRQARSLMDEITGLEQRLDHYVQSMDFGFLFDPQRQVFHIGFNVDTGRLDPNYYDLLASEARITSLLAIAKGDVPQSHWLHLARPVTRIDDMRVLLSWSGTMFEYLMPSLLMKSYPDTLLDQSCRAAIRHQIDYVRGRGIPWGISESSYYNFDVNQVYQYRAFGVPGLGYKRGLSDELVISPYASFMALSYEPLEVSHNLERFEKLGMSGLYGLCEAADFTSERMGAGQEVALIHSYMAHHQGMILLALSNYLYDDIVVRRFHADPRIESVELLLQEQIPVRAPLEHPHPQEVGSLHPVHPAVSLDPWKATTLSRLHCLSNEDYSILLTAAGGGFSRWRKVDLTRWRADPTLDPWGSWIYIQDLDTRALWSVTLQPTGVQPESQNVLFYPHKIDFERRDGTISTRMTVAVAPDAAAEIRLVSLTNHAGAPRHLSLTSYAEVVLSQQLADQRHPAFSKMFVESEYLPGEDALLFRRRPRSDEDRLVYLVHLLVSPRNDVEHTGYETDRARFLGRGRTARMPAVFENDGRLSNTTGATLDPLASIQAGLTLPAYGDAQLAFVTLAAPSRKEALLLAAQFRRWGRIQRSLDELRVEAEQELSQLELTSSQLEQIQKLLSVLFYPGPALRAPSEVLAANTLGQPGLWPFGISGDCPILLVNVKDSDSLDLLGELLRGHAYWRRRGLLIDMVIMNQRESSYDRSGQERIYRLLSRTSGGDWLNKRGGVFILQEDQLTEQDRVLLASAARAVVESGGGSLAYQLERLDRLPVHLPHFVPVITPPAVTGSDMLIEHPPGLLFDNGLGGFSPDGREYVIYLDNDQWTPAPWANVIANPSFGFLVSESGLGCTWAINSGENRLTPWHNDPVSDPPAEAIYLRDEDTGQLWSPTPLPIRADAPYLIRHGCGYSIFEHHSHGLEQMLTVFAVPDAPVKVVRLKLTNRSGSMRRIQATYYAEWVLGTLREQTAQHIVPEFTPGCFALLARNPYNVEFGQRVAFLAASREVQGMTTDRSEFLGMLGSLGHPAALERVGLTASLKAGSDPCAALQTLLWLAPGETKEVTFLLGQGADRIEALSLSCCYQSIENVEAAWQAVQRTWDEILGTLQVQTPDPAMDVLLNRWLLYEALSCRIWGRTGYYQSSGAFGFRDQLQDCLALLQVRPDLARAHIMATAARQFTQGDVLHWWHSPGVRGIRTRISDNLLWLPYVTAHYVRVTGDRTLLDEIVPFLMADPLKDDENERYAEFRPSGEATIYEHCLRAIEHGATSGRHGLPLIGAGDWNDGMNRVGINGAGESVWLGWFLVTTLDEFAVLCEMKSEPSRAAGLRERAKSYRRALETHAWDGGWYRRAYFDNGSPLGSTANTECQIDSISQSWAAISGAASPERAHVAMDAFDEYLVRRDDRLVLLLAPPFDRTMNDPGYIKGYVPGIRENGGQYTHAALWAAWAYTMLDEGDRAWELFDLLNPIRHADTPEKIARYRVEPYVVAADVYSAPQHLGRGGWTWYTGSASWMVRLGIERILGVRREGNMLHVDPCIPRQWPGFTVDYRFDGAEYHIVVENPSRVDRGVRQVFLDEKLLPGNEIPLGGRGRKVRHVRVVMGGG